MMRLLTVTLLALLIAPSAFAQWDYVEEFNNGIPQNWFAANNWNWDQSGTFPTPYIWATANENNNPRIQTGPIDISGADRVVFQFYYYVRGGGGSAGYSYRVGENGDWFYVDDWTIPGSFYGVANGLLEEDELTDDVLYVSWGAGFTPDGGIRELALDNFRVSTQLPGWVNFDADYLTSTGLPHGGGDVVFNLNIENTFPVPLLNLRVGTMIQFGDQIYGPFNRQLVNVPANSTLPLNNQRIFIPGFLEPYWIFVTPVVGYAGMPSFQFMDWDYFYIRSGVTDSVDEQAITQWKNEWLYEPTGWQNLAVSADPQSSMQFKVHGYPNPFNASTTITVDLSQSAELTVFVYNTLGQQVAELADGPFGAGNHDFTFDGSNLSGGIYFVQAAVPGELNSVQKIVLMK
jgi:Secretion system C-terminal sorting domain